MYRLVGDERTRATRRGETNLRGFELGTSRRAAGPVRLASAFLRQQPADSFLGGTTLS